MCDNFVHKWNAIAFLSYRILIVSQLSYRNYRPYRPYRQVGTKLKKYNRELEMNILHAVQGNRNEHFESISHAVYKWNVCSVL